MRAMLALALLVSVGAAVLCLRPNVNPGHDGAIAGASAPLFAEHRQAYEQLREVSAQLPLVFEPNQGQSDPRVKFLSRGLGYGLFLTADAAVLKLEHSAVSNQHSATQAYAIRMGLVGAESAAEIKGAEALTGKSNYFIGNDRSNWRTSIPQYARVRYANVYRGIDLVYYGKQGQLEYDFVVAPGADPKQVVLSFDGPDQVEMGAGGDLLLRAANGSIRLQAPRVYQDTAGRTEQVSGHFVTLGRKRVSFEIGPYDHSRELVIDPILTYSTYLGGSGNEGCSAVIGTVTAGCPAIAADQSGANFYVAGTTTSGDFPTTTGAFQKTPASGATANVFVSKFNASGSALVFSTYLGGNGVDYPVGVAVDSGFNVYVAGTTTSSNFPNGQITPFQASATGTHVFISQLDSNGAKLSYSSYLAGSGSDTATGMAIDNKGSVFVTGTTTSNDFPISTTIPPYQKTFPAGNTAQFFATKLSTLSSNSGKSGLLYSTYFGGSNPATGAVAGGGIAVDSNGNFYITGTTNYQHVGNSATDFPIVNGFDACLNTAPPANGTTSTSSCSGPTTPTDAFVAKFNPTGTGGQGSLLYSTYLGGSADDHGIAITVDSGFNAYVTGWTTSTDVLNNKPLPAGTTSFQSSNGGLKDAFIAKVGGAEISSTNTVFPLNYFSYLGGSADDLGFAIAVDSVQNVRVAGSTQSSTDFPVTPKTPPNPVQPGGFGGGTDAFVALIDTTATSTTTAGQWATFLGGAGNDDATGVALDVNGTTYVTGDTTSNPFTSVTTSSPAFQSSLNGTSDIFVSKIGAQSSLAIPAFFPTPPGTAANPAVSPNPVGAGNQVTFTYTIVNNGPDPATNVVVTDVLASGATFNSATASPGSCLAAPNNGVETCAMGTLPVTPSGATSANTIKINLTPTAAGSLGDTISVTANGSTTPVTASGTVQVTDFQISASPTSATVTAGQPASYTVTVTPLPTYSGQVSLSCSAGVPSQASCAFSTSPVSFTNSGAVQSTLTINTVARPVTTADGQTGKPTHYGTWLPMSGLALLGLGIGARSTRQRRLLGGGLLLVVVALLALQPACSSSKTPTTPPTGTPAGTYAVTITGSSGAASHTTTVNLVVQ